VSGLRTDGAGLTAAVDRGAAATSFITPGQIAFLPMKESDDGNDRIEVCAPEIDSAYELLKLRHEQVKDSVVTAAEDLYLILL